MSWQDDVMIEQEQADALVYMSDTEWKECLGKGIKLKGENE